MSSLLAHAWQVAIRACRDTKQHLALFDHGSADICISLAMIGSPRCSPFRGRVQNSLHCVGPRRVNGLNFNASVAQTGCTKRISVESL
jgi:hypothetical protein